MIIYLFILFLGFVFIIILFVYVIVVFWINDYKVWLKFVLCWSFFSGVILGIGILMGGVWAYEVFSFGGYWAWDLVENMLLVFWFFFIVGIYINLIVNVIGYFICSMYIFYVLIFIFILYFIFLIWSGVLGDILVYVFMEMGLEIQLILLIGFYIVLLVVLIGKCYNSIFVFQKEEVIVFWEFWMFIGLLVLLFLGFIILVFIFLLVYNKIMMYFNLDYIG